MVISPRFAVLAPRGIFAAAALLTPLIGIGGAVLAHLAEKRDGRIGIRWLNPQR